MCLWGSSQQICPPPQLSSWRPLPLHTSNPLQAVPKPDEGSSSQHAAHGSAKGQGEEDEEVMALPEICISVREARPVHLMWKQVRLARTGGRPQASSQASTKASWCRGPCIVADGFVAQVTSDIHRYHEEAAAAADFFQHSSGLMTNHLKNNLLQVTLGQGRVRTEWCVPHTL